MPPPAETWQEWLRRLLCDLYKELGGDCKELFGPTEDRIAKVIAQYQAKGAPVFSTPQEKTEFLKLLDEIEEALDHPDNDLDKQAEDDLQQLLSDLRKDVGP
ncbi:MAG: hypothetical protein AB7Q00_08040 [Phycisphaerales bacterium]